MGCTAGPGPSSALERRGPPCVSVRAPRAKGGPANARTNEWTAVEHCRELRLRLRLRSPLATRSVPAPRPKPTACQLSAAWCSELVIFGNTRLSSRTHCDSPVQARSTGEVLKAEPWTASPRRAVDRRAENAHLLREPRLFARDEHVSTGGGQEHTGPWDKSLPQERRSRPWLRSVALGRGSGRTGV